MRVLRVLNYWRIYTILSFIHKDILLQINYNQLPQHKAIAMVAVRVAASHFYRVYGLQWSKVII